MAAVEKSPITDKTKLRDLTVGEFKALMKEIMQEVVWDIEDLLPDPDEGKELSAEVVERLQKYEREKPKGRPAKDIMKELGLDE